VFRQTGRCIELICMSPMSYVPFLFRGDTRRERLAGLDTGDWHKADPPARRTGPKRQPSIANTPLFAHKMLAGAARQGKHITALLALAGHQTCGTPSS